MLGNHRDHTAVVAKKMSTGTDGSLNIEDWRTAAVAAATSVSSFRGCSADIAVDSSEMTDWESCAPAMVEAALLLSWARSAVKRPSSVPCWRSDGDDDSSPIFITTESDAYITTNKQKLARGRPSPGSVSGNPTSPTASSSVG